MEPFSCVQSQEGFHIKLYLYQILRLGYVVARLLFTYAGNDQIGHEVSEPLKAVGVNQSNTLLTASHHYLLQNPKLSVSNKAFVLEAINNVVSDTKIVKELDEQLVLLMINLVTQEMTMTSKDFDTDWAEAGKDVLVTLQKTPRFVTHVLDAVLQKFSPGLTTSPHRYVVLTLATIAEHNPLSRTTYTDQAEAIYDVVFNWFYSKDPKTRAEAGECIGELCLMIRPEKVVEDLVNTILGLYKKAYTEQHTITKAVCRFLEATCPNEACPLDPYVEDILNALFPNACLDPDDTTTTLTPQAIKNHSEAFRCFHVAASRFADRIVYYLLHKIQSVVDMQKLGATY